MKGGGEMKGRVKIFNVARGFGFISGEEGREYFGHWRQVRYCLERDIDEHLPADFLFLIPGMEVMFEPVEQKDGRWQAHNVQPLDGVPDEVKTQRYQSPKLEKGVARVTIDGEGQLCFAGEKPVPVVEVEGLFQAYFLGYSSVKGWSVKLPDMMPDRAFLLIDDNKNPRRQAPDGIYEFSKPDAAMYVLRLEREEDEDGDRCWVTIWNLGRRRDDRFGPDEEANWLILETRYEHNYDLVDPVPMTVEELLKQTPTSGKARDNDGFVPAIVRGLEMMKAVAAK